MLCPRRVCMWHGRRKGEGGSVACGMESTLKGGGAARTLHGRRSGAAESSSNGELTPWLRARKVSSASADVHDMFPLFLLLSREKCSLVEFISLVRRLFSGGSVVRSHVRFWRRCQ